MTDSWVELVRQAKKVNLALETHRSKGAVRYFTLRSLIGLSTGALLLDVRTYDLGDAETDAVLLATAAAAIAALPDNDSERDRLAAHLYAVQGGNVPWPDVEQRIKDICRKLADAAIATGADPRRLP